MNAELLSLLFWGTLIIVPTSTLAWWGVKEER